MSDNTVSISSVNLPDGDILVIRRNSSASIGQGKHVVRLENETTSCCYYEVIEHRPRPLKVGDRVINARGFYGRILHIDDNLVWFKSDGGISDILSLGTLKKV